MLVQLITALLGSLGFALIFNERKQLMLPACLGGLGSWAVYLAVRSLGGGLFFAVFMASIFAALYSEIMARGMKLPATVIFIPAAIPLVPGGSLYYTMQAAVYGSETMIKYRGSETLHWALAIALGMSLVRAFFRALPRIGSRPAK